MAIDEEVAVRGVLVLADARLGYGRADEQRQTPGEIFAHGFRRFGGDETLAAIGIELRSMRVNRDLGARPSSAGIP